jgi:membrane protein CcdC involved in cytochrome C biogenesis
MYRCIDTGINRNIKDYTKEEKPMNHSASIVVPVVLIAFALYRRIRRTIGYQKLAKRAMTTRIVIFAIIGALILAAGAMRPIVYVYDLAGIAAGVVLAYYAIRTTTFERRGDSWFYRPNPWVGIILLALFIGRVADRLYEVYTLYGSSSVHNAGNQAQLNHDPFTAVVLFAIVTYYAVYYTFVIRKEKHLQLRGDA